MKKIILIVMLLAFSLGCFAADVVNKPNSVNTKQPLTLTIKSDKEVYGIGEYIVINLDFRNDSDSPVTLKFEKSGRMYAFFTFKIYRNDEELKPYRYFDLKDMVFPIIETKVAPNSTYNMKLVINKLDWVTKFKSMFEIPGIYKITIIYGLCGETLVSRIDSNTIIIKIVDKK